MWAGNMKLLMKGARSTRKENLFLSGLRYQGQMEATIGQVMKHMLQQVMLMMFNDNVPIINFSKLLFQLYILFPPQLLEIMELLHLAAVLALSKVVLLVYNVLIV